MVTTSVIRRDDGWHKHHTADRPYRQERDAYLRIAGRDVPAPRLLSRDDDRRWLLLSHCPGGRADPTDAAVHRGAGAALARLHRVPCAPDPMPLSDALPLRVDRWVRSGRGVLPASVLAGVRDRLSDLDVRGLGRTLCHRDFQPRNWVVDRDVVRIVDLEHTRGDLWLTDLVKLAAGPWHDAPALRDAFLEGYGRAPSPDDDARLDALVLLHGLATAVWGRRHGDPELAAEGRAVLGRFGFRV